METLVTLFFSGGSIVIILLAAILAVTIIYHKYSSAIIEQNNIQNKLEEAKVNLEDTKRNLEMISQELTKSQTDAAKVRQKLRESKDKINDMDALLADFSKIKISSDEKINELTKENNEMKKVIKTLADEYSDLIHRMNNKNGSQVDINNYRYNAAEAYTSTKADDLVKLGHLTFDNVLHMELKKSEKRSEETTYLAASYINLESQRERTNNQKEINNGHFLQFTNNLGAALFPAVAALPPSAQEGSAIFSSPTNMYPPRRNTGNTLDRKMPNNIDTISQPGEQGFIMRPR